MKLGRLMPKAHFMPKSSGPEFSITKSSGSGSLRARLILSGVIALGFANVSQAQNLIGSSVVLRTLDKVTATTQDYTVKIGESLSYGSLTIDVKHCEKRPPEDIPETYAFLQITDGRQDGRGQNIEAERLFSGWMLASKPAISALDHPVYDVWVLDCNVKKTANAFNTLAD